MRTLLLLLVLAGAADAAPVLVPLYAASPDDGTQRHVVPLPDAPALPCVAFAHGPATVRVARSLLEELAAEGEGPGTHVLSARTLLEQAPGPEDDDGCAALPPSKAGLRLLGALLDAGQAALRVDGAAVPHVEVELQRQGGVEGVRYRLPDGRELMSTVTIAMREGPAAAR